MKYKKSNKYFKIFILWATLIIIFIGGVKIFASETYFLEDKNLIPKNTIVLDEPSSQALVYISPDQGILLFRSSTSQLEQLHVGDVLWLNAAAKDNYGFLRQIIYVSKEESNNKGIIIKTIPLIENHSPIISGLIARPSNLEIGQQSELTCYAADEDKDELYYSWISTGGTLLGNAANVTWIAPNQTGDYLLTCEVIDHRGGKDSRSVQLWVVEKFPLLTEQEKKLIKKYGWSNNRVIRWPDGYVEVYDDTNFSRMQEVLDQWNEVVEGKVNFYLSDNPYSPVKITYDHTLREQSMCGHVDAHWRNYRLYAAEITINPDFSFCGFPEDNFGLYLHLFAGVVGFDAWKGTTVDRREWQEFTLIPDIMQRMIKSLYKIPTGYDLDRDL